MKRVEFIGRRGETAIMWCRRWAAKCRAMGARFVSNGDVTNLRARFHAGADMENIVDVLMANDFSVSYNGITVTGFPTDIQDEVTGEPTRLEGLDD